MSFVRPADYFRDVPDVQIDPQMLKLAEHILQNKAAPFDPTAFVDRYEQAVVELLEGKRKGLPVAAVNSIAPPRSTPDLIEALKRSLAKSLPLAPANDGKTSKAPKAKKQKRGCPASGSVAPDTGQEGRERQRRETGSS